VFSVLLFNRKIISAFVRIILVVDETLHSTSSIARRFGKYSGAPPADPGTMKDLILWSEKYFLRPGSFCSSLEVLTDATWSPCAAHVEMTVSLISMGFWHDMLSNLGTLGGKEVATKIMI